MKKYVLGIDVGTTGTKTLLMSTEGEILGHAYQGYPLDAPEVGWSEQSAEDWWDAVVATVKSVCANLDHPEDVAAISLSLQGGTVVPVDANGNPLRKAIVWSDGRCAQQMKEFEAEGGSGDYTYERCGWGMSTGLPCLYVRWIKDNQPEIFEKTAMFLTVPDYISLKMTGIAAVDLSDAGINEFCDIRKGTYDEKLMSFAGITEKQLPVIRHTGDVIGPLTEEAAGVLGLTTGTLLIAGAHDQYAVAVGAGANSPGDVVIGSGTAWVVTGISDKPAFETGLAQSIAAIPGLWGSIFSLSTGGVCLDWLRNQISCGGDGREETALRYDVINEEIKDRHPAWKGVYYYPFQGIAGADKRFSRASFTGLDLSHNRFDLAAAIMEGVVFQIRWMMESFEIDFEAEDAGVISLAGGASKSPAWAQMIADITGLPVSLPGMPDLACIGAAVIAGWGGGLFASIPEGYEKMKTDTITILPDPIRRQRYQTCYHQYKHNAELLFRLYQEETGGK